MPKRQKEQSVTTTTEQYKQASTQRNGFFAQKNPQTNRYAALPKEVLENDEACQACWRAMWS